MRIPFTILLALFASACLSRSPVVTVRYFEPAPVSSGTGGTRPNELRPLEPLRLERIHEAPALAEPMVWRVSPIEVAFDDAHQWAATPARLLEQRLESALFVDGPFEVSNRAQASALHLELRAFEGVYGEPARARLALFVRYAPRGDAPARTRLVEQEVALEAARPEELARGMAVALDVAVEELRDWLVR